MAIYPIVKGQKLDQRNVIPPHITGSGVNSQSTKTDKPKEVQPQNDLIDFGQTEAPTPPQPALQPALQPTAQPVTQPAAPPVKPQPVPTKSQAEISNLLSSTGKKADGPLIDFTNDVKRDLPSTTHQ